MNMFYVILGGGVGAGVRWLLTGFLNSAQFPMGTLSVNLLGCLFIGVASCLLLNSPKMSLLLITGFLGGFTTFSSFGLDSFQLLRNQNYIKFLTYVGLSNVLGIILVILGHKTTSYFI